jgi:hypothetical protein
LSSFAAGGGPVFASVFIPTEAKKPCRVPPSFAHFCEGWDGKNPTTLDVFAVAVLLSKSKHLAILSEVAHNTL